MAVRLEKALPILLEAVADEDDLVGFRAIRALAEIKDPEVARVLPLAFKRPST
jgi:HEAT repeat protein